MPTKLRALIVEDTEDDELQLLRLLKRGGFDVTHERVQTAAGMRAALDRQAWDIVISDFGMPGFNGLAALALLRERDLHLPFIVVSGSIGEDTAVAMMKGGASDYVMKDNLARLVPAVEREMRDAKVRRQRRQARDALQESAAALHRAQSIAHLGHVITGPDGQFESWSETLPQLVGLDPAKLPTSARAWLELVHPDDREYFRRSCIDAGGHGSRVEVEYRMRRGDGAWICMRQVVEPISARGDSAAPVRWFNTMQDVTAQKNAEEKRRASELRYRRLFEAAKDGILILNAGTGRVEDVNPFLVELLGMPRADFLGKTLWDLGLWKDIALSKAAFKELQENDYIRYEYLPFETHDGRRVDVEFVSNAYVVDGVRVIQCNIRDITERKRAARILALEHETVRCLAEADNEADGLKEVIRVVSEANNWDGGVFWRVDDAGGVLRFSQTWFKSDSVLGKYEEVARAMTFGPGVGMMGRVWQSGEPVWIQDAGKDVRVEQKSLAQEASLRGAFGFPVAFHGKTIGVLAFYCREIRKPDDRLTSAVQVIGSQVGQFLRRKQDEAALRESEARFRSLTKLSSDWYWEQDSEFRFIKFSGGEESGMWGPDQAAQIGKRRWDLPDIRPISSSWDEHRKLLDAHEPFRDFEYFRDTTGSDPRYVAASGEPLFDRDGRFTGYRGTARDIGKSKQAEEEQRASRQLLDNIIENIPTAVQLKSVADDGRIVIWNKGAEEIFGVPRRDALGHTVHDLWPQADADRMRAADIALVAEGGMQDFPDRLAQTRSRGDIRVHMRKVPLVDDAGRTTHLLVIADDITSRLADEARLRESESLKSAVLESSLDCIITMDDLGKILEFNPAAETKFGLSREQALGKSLADLIIPPGLREAHNRGLARYRATGEGAILGKRIEIRAIRADGVEIPVELAVTPIKSGSRTLFTGFIRDITERKEAEERIRRLNRVYAVLSGINTLIVRVRDRDELFREACRVAVESGGFGIAWIGMIDRETKQIRSVAWQGAGSDLAPKLVQVVGERPSASDTLVAHAIWGKRPVVSNDIERDTRLRVKAELLAAGLRSVIVLPLLVSGEAVGALTLAAAEINFFDDEEIKLLAELAGDISFAIEHIEKSVRVEYLAYYDQVTGLANRTLFLERVGQRLIAASAANEKVAVVSMDIDRFKSINDALGRVAGDDLLKQIAGRMRQAGGTDERLARIDADHFAVVVTEAQTEAQLGRLIDRRVKEIFDPIFRVGESELRVSAKFGISVYPDDGTDAEALLRNASEAVMKAKSRGEQYVFYTQAMTERTVETLTFENKLRQALQKEEFILHYQPKVDLATRKITGVEALIRWQSGELGLVPPVKFIPLMEETGLILEAGAWALARAVKDHSRWLDMGLPAPRVAVNVSAVQLRRKDFVATVAAAIRGGAKQTGIDLEITESLIMEDVAGTIRKLKEVRELGMSIGIDDFGTGYSSLAYLAKLPVHTLKIDRSFIITMLNDPDTMTLISTIISLAHSLRLTVVAEGVELEEQAKVLRLLRCDEMQGYLFSKPLPFDALTDLLKKVSGQTNRPEPVAG